MSHYSNNYQTVRKKGLKDLYLLFKSFFFPHIMYTMRHQRKKDLYKSYKKVQF